MSIINKIHPVKQAAGTGARATAPSTSTDPGEGLTRALVRGTTTDVETLMKNATFKINEFATAGRLITLYTRARAEYRNMLPVLPKPSGVQLSLQDISAWLTSLLDTRTTFQIPVVNAVEDAEILPGSPLSLPYRDLMMFSLAIGAEELALFFWPLCEGLKTAHAVSSNHMLKNMAAKISGDDEISEQIMKMANGFESKAMALTKRCFAENEPKTLRILVTKDPHIGGFTCFETTVNSDCKEFMVSEPFVRLVDEMWMSSNVLTDRESQEKRSSSSICRAIFSSPTSIAIAKAITNFIFIILFSYTLLFKISDYASVFELAVFVIVISFVADEIRQYVIEEGSTAWRKFINYISLWNCLDIIAMLMCMAGFIVHAVYNSTYVCNISSYMEAVRVLYSLSICLFIIRFVQLFLVSKLLGPKVIMIGYMMQDMVFFLVLLLLFMFAYGIAAQALLYPDEQDWTKVLLGIVYRPYWQMYGELFLDQMTGIGVADCTSTTTTSTTTTTATTAPTPTEPMYFDNLTTVASTVASSCPDASSIVDYSISTCPEVRWLPPIMLAIYMLFANVLMLNLLIAMFSFTIQDVHENSDKFWMSSRCQILKEYSGQHILLIPPFNLITLFIPTVVSCVGALRPDHEFGTGGIVFSDIPDILGWEADHARKLMDALSKKELTMDERMKNIEARLRQMEGRQNHILDKQDKGQTDFKDKLTGLEGLQINLEQLLQAVDANIVMIKSTLMASSSTTATPITPSTPPAP